MHQAPKPPKRPTPRTRLPPLNALRAFDATARHLTVVKAADELSVTPSAVSHQLRTLEKALGVALFVRSKTRLKLTPHGQALLPSIRSAFQMIAAATANPNHTALAGDLVVSAPIGLTSRFVARHIAGFLSAYPDVHLKLVTSNDEREVYSPAVDLCIRYGAGIWANRQVKLLSHVELFPVCSPAMTNAARGLHELKDLRNQVLLCEDAGTEWTRWLLAAGAHCDGFRMAEMGNAHTAIEAALHGQGAALGDQLLVGDDLVSGALVRLFGTSIAAKHAYYTVCRHEVCDNPLISGFVEWIRAQVDIARYKLSADGA